MAGHFWPAGSALRTTGLGLGYVIRASENSSINFADRSEAHMQHRFYECGRLRQQVEHQEKPAATYAAVQWREVIIAGSKSDTR